MLTVITTTTIKPGGERDWDAAYQERAADARTQPGWIDLHLLAPVDDAHQRVVIGTWRDRPDWERWHESETFQRTRATMDAVTSVSGEDRWYEVIEDRSSPDQM
jgi:heme-degrading monooxygenase HmoA